MIYFFNHSVPLADSRGAVVSFWRKNVQLSIRWLIAANPTQEKRG